MSVKSAAEIVGDAASSRPTPSPRPLRPLAAWLMKRLEGADDADYRRHKRALFADLGGAIVEIGPGTGANLAYLPRDIALTAIEPSPAMRRYLEARAAELGRSLTLLDGTAERLPLPDCERRRGRRHPRPLLGRRPRRDPRRDSAHPQAGRALPLHRACGRAARQLAPPTAMARPPPLRLLPGRLPHRPRDLAHDRRGGLRAGPAGPLPHASGRHRAAHRRRGDGRLISYRGE